jgi:hypothetical protein
MELHEAYTQRRQAELDEYDAEIKTIEVKSTLVPPDEQMQFYADLQTLRAQHAKMQQKLGELRESNGHRWTDLKEELETAWKDLQNGMQRADQSVKAG